MFRSNFERLRRKGVGRLRIHHLLNPAAASFMLYFAYGSNLNYRSVADWARHYGHKPPALRGGRPAILDNYRLAFPVFSEYWGGGTADIVPEPGKSVSGAVFELGESDWETLDAKVRRHVEDGGTETGVYKKINVVVRPLGRGPTMKAMTYQGVQQEAFHIPPTQNYLDLLVTGAFEHGLSAMWVSYLKTFSTQGARDPKPPRVTAE